MAYRLLGTVALLVFLVAVNTSGADAKSPSFIITGGELSDYAAVVSSPWPEGPYLPFGAPASQLVSVVGPEGVPSLRYDVYEAGPYQAARGPDYHYYPEERILYDIEYDHWFDVLPDWAAFMESAIDGALAEKERGELEIGPIAAGLRQSRIPDGSLWLRSFTAGEWSTYEGDLGSGRCPVCIGLVGRPEQFVMRDMLETLSREPITTPSSRLPAYSIEFYSRVGRGGVGGIVGFYAPQEAGEPGRFWPSWYNNDTEAPYFETTPGFDAAIEAVLAGPYASTPETSAAGTDGSGFRNTAAGAALLAVVLGVGGVGGFVRRRG